MQVDTEIMRGEVQRRSATETGLAQSLFACLFARRRGCGNLIRPHRKDQRSRRRRV